MPIDPDDNDHFMDYDQNTTQQVVKCNTIESYSMVNIEIKFEFIFWDQNDDDVVHGSVANNKMRENKRLKSAHPETWKKNENKHRMIILINYNNKFVLNNCFLF